MQLTQIQLTQKRARRINDWLACIINRRVFGNTGIHVSYITGNPALKLQQTIRHPFRERVPLNLQETSYKTNYPNSRDLPMSSRRDDKIALRIHSHDVTRVSLNLIKSPTRRDLVVFRRSKPSRRILDIRVSQMCAFGLTSQRRKFAENKNVKIY